jgi:hypothetical protein
MRNKSSALNTDLYHAHLILYSNCLCGYIYEYAEQHYLLHCSRFTLSRIIMLFEINKLNLIGIPVNIDLLLFEYETLSCDINFSIFSFYLSSLNMKYVYNII